MPASETGLVARAQSGGAPPAGTRSLADLLAAGPLPLPVAVAYAKEIASGAAAFHRSGRPYGALASASITVGPHGPALPRPNRTAGAATLSSDLRDFGSLLQEMLTCPDPGSCSPPASADDDLGISPATVRSAALRLAERCRCAPGEADLRHVSTELRLLHIMTSSFGAGEVARPVAEDRPVEQPAASAPAKPEESGVRDFGCPSCGSSDVFPAQRLTILEKLLAVAELKTYRCYRCCQRFVSVFGISLPRPENE